MLHSSLFENSKNLLAFSGGIDSSALFFLLIEHNIPFDIAHINYGTRTQSDDEERSALKLANDHNLKAYTTKAPQWESHFEANARAFRYQFFEDLIERHQYDTLLTAHQLDDRLEWFLMRLAKGAGVAELTGLEEMSDRKTTNGILYRLIRPLLEQTKEELRNYLDMHRLPYFVDETNQDTTIERNYFRKYFSDPLITQYTSGIKRSFGYLQEDKEVLKDGIRLLFAVDELRILALKTPQQRVRAADQTLKELGYLLSAKQRKEIELHPSIVIGGRWVVEARDLRLFIAPYMSATMPKSFKELCRKASLPAKIRPYCFLKNILPHELMG